MTLFLVRHASAGTRGTHPGPDIERPLDDRGIDQAEDIVKLLGDTELDHILSSEATRCVDTVRPLAEHQGLVVEVHPALAEGQGPAATLALVDRLADAGTTAVMCTHGDILPDVIEALVRGGAGIEGPRSWEKGCTWRLEVHDGAVARVSLVVDS